MTRWDYLYLKIYTYIDELYYSKSMLNNPIKPAGIHMTLDLNTCSSSSQMS